jgi:hypothetical protein
MRSLRNAAVACLALAVTSIGGAPVNQGSKVVAGVHILK